VSNHDPASEATSRPPSVAPPSGTTLLGPRRAIPPIGRRPERRLAGDPRDPPAATHALRARMRAALAHADAEGEAQAAARLARHLFAIDAQLDEAVTSGRRAITLRPDDAGLRVLVSDALRALGEPGLAAAMLRPAVDAACARASRDAAAAEHAVNGLLTLGDLLLRAGDVDGAIESFRYVTVVAPERAEGQERLAIAHGIAPGAIPSEIAARAYIGAARKHQLGGDDARALEALARAFEVEPKSPLAANVLADALEELGRLESADAVRSEHARALSSNLEAAAVVHATRREKARVRNDRAAIVASVLDELVELVAGTTPGNARESARVRIDAALDDVPELAEARRRVDALLSVGPVSLECFRKLARASESPERRLEAYTEIIVRDSSDETALAAMREHARLTRDPLPIVDALVRALRNTAGLADRNVLAARCAELAGWADEQLGDAPLAAWAWGRLLSIAPGDTRARDELQRLSGRVAQADQRLRALEEESSSHDDARRADALRREIAALFGRPDREAEILGAIEDLLEAAAGDPFALQSLDRLARRAPAEEGRFALELRERVTADAAARGRVRVGRVEIALRRGDVEGAIALAGSSESPELAALLVALALRAGGVAELGHALARFAPVVRERATVLAAASHACRIAELHDDARRFGEEGFRAGGRDLHAARELAELAAARPDVVPDDVAGPVLERALAGIGPRARWALALARIAEVSSETPLAVAWTRRAWSLRPGDLEIAALWLARASTLQDPEVISEVVRATSSLVATLAPLVIELADALRVLFVDDARTGETIARELLASGAARLSPIREAILNAPSAPPALVIAVHERWLASAAATADRPPILLAIAEAALAAHDLSRAVDAAGRLLAEPDADEATGARARAIVRQLEGGLLDADAELTVHRSLAEAAARDALDILDHAPRARLTADAEARLAACSDTFRTLGRDLWDLADDRESALRAWLRGARFLGSDGLERLEADIAHFGGEEAARDALFELARRESDEDTSTLNLARRALFEEFRLRAWERLLAQPPSWVEPLSLAREAAARASDPAALLPGLEILAQRHQRFDVLHDLYEIAAGRTAGRFGMRAVHYRAARILERAGRADDALGHAVRAFSAVPSEGAMLMMLERLAEGSRRADIAVSALVEAADQADDAEKKATWLDRAVTIARSDATAPEERAELLLRLFVTAPSARTAEALVAAVRSVIALDPAVRDTWSLRLRRAHKRVESAIGWSQRVPIVVALAALLIDIEGPEVALDLVGKTAGETPRADLPPLRELAETLAARDPEAARAWLERKSEGGPVRAHLAWGAGDPDRAIELLAEHAATNDEFDLGEDDGGVGDAEIGYLERWAPSARDKGAVARAWERFGRRQGAHAELEAAKALDEAGQTHEAARALIEAWRSREQATPEILREILTLAHAILPQASADAALVDMLVDDLQANEGGDSLDRVARWRQIAELRGTRLGDRHGALEALVEAGRIAPADDDLWNEIGDLAEAIGAHERLAAALAQRLQRARPDKRVTLLRKLARVLEHDLGRDDEAAERWAELVRLLPLDAEAADALERIAERRGDVPQLLELLRARASRLPVGHAERTRALRRVARELGGVPGRRGEVLSALREVHQQNPGDVDVAMQLAALARSAGDLGTAAEALMRAFRSATRNGARVQLAIESARILLEVHDHDTAARVLHEAATASPLENEPRALDLVRLQLEVAIARSDVREEALARVKLADLDTSAVSERRAANAGAAARALLTLGETQKARELAWRAARSAQGDVALTALLVELEFGVTTGHERRTASAEDGELLGLLLQIQHNVPNASAEHLAVIAFARADLLDLARGPGAGYQDLNLWPEEVRARAPVQLALAERLASEWSFGQAAVAYEQAFAGDLHGLRAIGPTALAAADAAARSNDPTRARAFLDLAARDPACRIDARRRAVELSRAVGDFDGALRALERLAAEGSGNVRAQALADQARLLQSRDPEAAVEALRLAVQASEEDSALREELLRERAAIEGSGERRSLPPAPPPSLRDSGITSNRTAAQFEKALAMMGAPPTAEPTPPGAWIAPQSESEPPPPKSAAEHTIEPRTPAAPLVEERTSKLSEHPRLSVADDASSRPRSMPAFPRPAGSSGSLDLESLDRIAHDPNAPVAERVRALKTLGEAAHEAGREDEATRHFISALELGDIAAGDQAAELLGLMPGRASDLLLVRRRQVFLAPGDRPLLDALHHAALSVRDLVFARAIDHVRRAFDPVAGPVPPPPLDVQLDRPDLILPLLERRAQPVAAEALRLTWENAQPAFRKDPNLTRGLERVSGAIPVGRTVIAAGRLLGAARTPFFVRQRPGRDVEVILLSPPAVLLGGDCREDTADVRYVIGAGLIAAHPSHCLLLAQNEESARATFQALLSAFGPPEHGRGISPEVSRLAAALWQSIPRAAQRRLGELLGQQPPAFDVALEGARQVARRGGLYLAGDIAAAVRSTLGEAGVSLPASPDFAAICQQHPRVADLFRLATSPEFAEARWRVPGGARRSPSSGSGPSSTRGP